MDSTINFKPGDDPHDVLVVASDAVLMAPTEDELSRLARSLHHPAQPQTHTGPDLAASPAAPAVAVPPVDMTFRPGASGDAQLPGRRRTIGGRAARAFVAALLLAVGSAAAAMAWQSYGGTAQQMIARWTPQLARPAPTAVAAAAADPAPPQPAVPVPAAPQGAAPAAVAPAEPAPSLGSLTNDIASVRQQVEQLKASIEELKAGQLQMSRNIAKVSEAEASEVKASEAKAFEQNVRSKLSAHPRPATARLRKPTPPRQAAAYPALPQPAASYVPRQVQPLPPPAAEPPADPELASVPRPPMPLR